MTLSSGCISFGKKEEQTGVVTPAGTSVTKDGIELSFEESFPPSAVKTNTEFDVFVRVKNKGGYAIGEGEFDLNLMPSNFESKLPDADWSTTIPGWSNDETIEGVSIYGAGADFSIGSEVFGTFKYSGLAKGTTKDEDITAKACYFYQTNASGQICLKSNPDEESAICSEEGDPTYGKLQVLTSGPIHVSSVREKLTADSVELEINVEHVGNGEPYSYHSDCIHDKREDINNVFLKNLYVGTGKNKEDYTLNCCESKENPAKCAKERTRRLSEGKTTFKCEFTKPVQMVTTEPFEVVLTYKYSTSVKADVEVRI